MLKGSGDRIIPNMEGPAMRKYPGWEGATMSLNKTQYNSKTVCVPLRDICSLRTLYQGPPMLGHQLSPRKLPGDTGLYVVHTQIKVTFRF